jgi:hypothetical protein
VCARSIYIYRRAYGLSRMYIRAVHSKFILHLSPSRRFIPCLCLYPVYLSVPLVVNIHQYNVACCCKILSVLPPPPPTVDGLHGP